MPPEISKFAAFGPGVRAVTQLLEAGASSVWYRKCVFNGRRRTSVSVIELPSIHCFEMTDRKQCPGEDACPE